jgi:hypothetical protein
MTSSSEGKAKASPFLLLTAAIGEIKVNRTKNNFFISGLMVKVLEYNIGVQVLVVLPIYRLESDTWNHKNTPH